MPEKYLFVYINHYLYDTLEEAQLAAQKVYEHYYPGKTLTWDEVPGNHTTNPVWVGANDARTRMFYRVHVCKQDGDPSEMWRKDA